MPRSRLSTFLASAALVLLGPRLARTQPLTVETSAQAPIQDDLARARARALAEAMSQALEQAVAQAAPEVRGRLYVLTARARDYVPTYRVISEGEEAGSFRVRIEAQVDTPRLLRDLQGATPSKRGGSGRRPLQLCARTAGASEAPADLQAALRQAAEALTERGETVEQVAPPLCAGPVGVVGSSSPVRARLVLLPGPERIDEVRGTQPRLFGAQRTIEWQVERAGSSEPSALHERGEATAFAETAAEAQLAAAQQATQQALRKLMLRPGLLAPAGAGVTVSFEGLGGFAAYQQVLRALAAQPGVTRVEPRRFVSALGAGSGTAPGASDDQVQVFVHTATAAEALGASLGRTPLPGLRLQVMPLPAGDLRVLCVPEGALPTAASEAPSPAEPGEPAADRGAP